MKYLPILFIFISASLFPQSEKGVSPISSPLGGGREGATRAVVVGISDYKTRASPTFVLRKKKHIGVRCFFIRVTIRKAYVNFIQEFPFL